MITDPRVFEDAVVPDRLLHRGAELDQLLRSLEPAAQDTSTGGVLIEGPMGVGKTTLARVGLRRLDAVADAVDSAFVRCGTADAVQILRTVVTSHPDATASLGADQDVPALRTNLRELLEESYVVVLDEADALPRTGVLADLAAVPYLSLVAICHDGDRWRAQLGPTLASQFDHDRAIGLERYGVSELADILQYRADAGLAPGAVSRSLLETIADEAAGVARVGIQTLGAAAEVAVDRGYKQIRDDCLPAAFDRARTTIRKQALASLTIHHHLLYGLVHEAETIAAGDLHDRYEQRAHTVFAERPTTPLGRRQRRNCLRKLREYDLIERTGSTSDSRYLIVDQDVEPPPQPTEPTMRR